MKALGDGSRQSADILLAPIDFKCTLKRQFQLQFAPFTVSQREHVNRWTRQQSSLCVCLSRTREWRSRIRGSAVIVVLTAVVAASAAAKCNTGSDESDNSGRQSVVMFTLQPAYSAPAPCNYMAIGTYTHSDTHSDTPGTHRFDYTRQRQIEMTPELTCGRLPI